MFVDFGPGFEVVDGSGETAREIFVASITEGPEGVVTTVDNVLHGLEDGDVVSFREVAGMARCNDGAHKVAVLSPTTFSIGDTSGWGRYESGGIATQLQRQW